MKQLLTLVAAGLLVGTPALVAQSKKTRRSQPDRAQLEKDFERLMSGCKMTGAFTIMGRKSPKIPRNETYEIKKVTKLRGDKWRFDATIQYGGKRAVTVPVAVDVRWAGDTAMIQVTKLSIPFMGTYSARVLVYNGKYAGTWSGKNYGGHMYGSITSANGEVNKTGRL